MKAFIVSLSMSLALLACIAPVFGQNMPAGSPAPTVPKAIPYVAPSSETTKRKPDIKDTQTLNSSLPPARNRQMVTIDLSEQTERVTEGGKTVFTSPISSGRPWMPTPTGLFPIGTKQDPKKVPSRLSREFNSAMNWCVPVGVVDESGNSRGVFIHEGILYDPGTPAAYPASHGCIRLPKGKAKEFYDLIRPDAIVKIQGNSLDYFTRHFRGAELLDFQKDGKLLGWKWKPANGPDGEFLKLAKALSNGEIKGVACFLLKEGGTTTDAKKAILGFEFFGGRKDSPNIFDRGIPVSTYNKAVLEYNQKHPSDQVKPGVSIKRREE